MTTQPTPRRTNGLLQTPDTAALLSEVESLLGRFLTPEEVGEALSFSLVAIRRMASNGQIPGARKFVRSWRFHAAPFRAWSLGWWDPDDAPDFDTWMAELRRSIVES